MSQQHHVLVKVLADADVIELAAAAQKKADELQSDASAMQKWADAARKEIKRRKREGK